MGGEQARQSPRASEECNTFPSCTGPFCFAEYDTVERFRLKRKALMEADTSTSRSKLSRTTPVVWRPKSNSAARQEMEPSSALTPTSAPRFAPFELRGMLPSYVSLSKTVPPSTLPPHVSSSSSGVGFSRVSSVGLPAGTKESHNPSETSSIRPPASTKESYSPAAIGPPLRATHGDAGSHSTAVIKRDLFVQQDLQGPQLSMADRITRMSEAVGKLTEEELRNVRSIFRQIWPRTQEHGDKRR